MTFSNHAGTNYKTCDEGGFKNSIEERKKVEFSFSFKLECFEAAKNPLVFLDFASMKIYCTANPATGKTGHPNVGKVSVSTKAMKRDPASLLAGVELPVKVFYFICTKNSYVRRKDQSHLCVVRVESESDKPNDGCCEGQVAYDDPAVYLSCLKMTPGSLY